MSRYERVSTHSQGVDALPATAGLACPRMTALSLYVGARDVLTCS